MTELRALARERELRGYSKLRKAELIAFLQANENRVVQQQQQWQQQPTEDHEVVLTKRQRKRRCAKNARQAKQFANLTTEIETLHRNMEDLKEKILCVSKSAHSSFKRKKICSMKRDLEHISAQLADSEARLGSMRVPVNPTTRAPIP